ncbi:MAG: RecX family transcriptional regulator [Oscillospiraceae bacterium]|nr:RecX family transcriptional regulator [Oscillospiraceae bacterium]
MEYTEEFDKLKTKVFKYILYKKRTEAEVKQKFANEDQDMIGEIIEYAKEAGYISDSEYIEKAVNEFMRLKNMSVKEIRYKLMAKGLKKDIIEEYIDKNWDMLKEYEQRSSKNIILKKQKTMTVDEVKRYLMTKGYTFDIIEKVFNE